VAHLRYLDDAGSVRLCLGAVDGLAELVAVVDVVHSLRVPAVALVSGQHVLSEGQLRLAVDSDEVVVIHENQLPCQYSYSTKG
jgi:hypothetical protein